MFFLLSIYLDFSEAANFSQIQLISCSQKCSVKTVFKCVFLRKDVTK